MVVNTNSSSQHLPVFKGVNYHIWSLKMKTLFKSEELWNLVEDGFPDPDEGHAQRLRKNRKKDSKALFLIQQALHDDIFPRISAAETSHEAWEILQQEYMGDKKGEDMPKKVLSNRGEDMPKKVLSKRGEDMPNKELSKRLSFPSLVNGVRLSNNIRLWDIVKAIRQFRELLLIEWSPPGPEETVVKHVELFDFLRMARRREESEAARLLNEVVRGLPPSGRNANCLVAFDHERGEQYRKLMRSNEFTSLGLVLAGVWSDQPDFQLLATEKFREVLPDINCPAEIPFILEYDIVPRFEEFLERENFPELQTEAALALIGICYFSWMDIGERINFDPVKVLLKLLDSPRSDVCEKALLQLGHAAGIPEGRDRADEIVHPLLDKVLHPLLDELEKNDKLLPKLLPRLRNATYTLLRFCKGIDSREVEEEATKIAYGKPTAFKPAVRSHLDKVSTSISELSRLVCLTDEEVLTNACRVLACLTDDGSTYCKTRVVIGNDVCRQLVELLEHPSPSVVTPAIRTLENIALREDIQSQDIVEFGALPCLWKLLSRNIEEFDVWTTISSLTKGNKEWIKEKKNEVREKLEQYAEEKLGQLCVRLGVPIFVCKAGKADMVQELMNFLEVLNATTDELHAEEEQSSKGKKRRRESEQEKDANEEESEEETANNVPSDKDLCDAVGDIIKQVDIATLKSISDVTEPLGKRFGTDLTHREWDIWGMMRYHLNPPPPSECVSDEDWDEL